MSGRRPSLSVVVPAHEASAFLARCLAAVRGAGGDDCERIVVDDASTDGTAAVAGAAGARVVRLATRSGPAAARNAGARLASGDVLLFVDADVLVEPGALRLVRDRFAADPGIAALFGSYDDAPEASDWVSQFKNLMHHRTHQESAPEAATFWAGLGAVRRETFLASGGFDARRYPYASIEDVELGLRLVRAGHRVVLDRHLLGKHLKRWSFIELLRTDVLRRALPWSALIVESGELPAVLNLRRRERACATLVGAGVLLAFASPISKATWLAAAACGLAALWTDRETYRFFSRRRGVASLPGVLLLRTLYYLYCDATFAYVWLRGRLAALRATGRARAAALADER